MKHLTALLLSVLLLVTSCQQFTVNGIVKSRHVEAVVTVQQYSAYMVAGNVSFDWQTISISKQATDATNTLPSCNYAPVAPNARVGRVWCELRRYLVISWQGGERYCGVSKQTWDSVQMGQVVGVGIDDRGDVTCR